MSQSPPFDAEQAHKVFSATCFNKAWELIDKTDRTPEDDEQMIRLAQASLWHWSQRPDCTPKNMSIGYWQASRIYAILGQADNARHYAQLSLDVTPPDEPFCLGYAREALARAESLAGNDARAREHLAEARGHAESVADEEEKQLLVDDLKTLS